MKISRFLCIVVVVSMVMGASLAYATNYQTDYKTYVVEAFSYYQKTIGNQQSSQIETVYSLGWFDYVFTFKGNSNESYRVYKEDADNDWQIEVLKNFSGRITGGKTFKVFTEWGPTDVEWLIDLLSSSQDDSDSITNSASPNASSSINFTFEQVVKMIDAIAIDGNKLFKDSYEGSAPSNREDFFTQRGIALIWLSDRDEGSLFFFDNDSSSMMLWNYVDPKNYDKAMEILIPLVNDYIDYDNGGKITFILTSGSDFTNPFAKVEYSPQIENAKKTDSGHYNEYYSELEPYKTAVAKYISIALGKDTEDSLSKEAALKKGSKGEMVIRLQNRLNELGYSVGKADGSYGNKTKAAIEAFQADNQLAVTGEADSSTQELLFSDKAMTKEEASLARGIVELGKELSKIDVN